MTITPLQTNFLRSLSLNQNRKISIHSLGKKHFKTEVSIYKALKDYEKNGFGSVEKNGKYLVFTISEKGKAYLMENT